MKGNQPHRLYGDDSPTELHFFVCCARRGPLAQTAELTILQCSRCRRALARATSFCPFCGMEMPCGHLGPRLAAPSKSIPSNNKTNKRSKKSENCDFLPAPPEKNICGFFVGQTECKDCQQLVQALTRNWSDGLTAIHSDAGLETWLKSDMGDSAIADRYVGMLHQFSKLDDSSKLSLTIALLDPSYPPYVDGLELTPERLTDFARAGTGLPQILKLDSEAFACFYGQTQAVWLKQARHDWIGAQHDVEELDAKIRQQATTLPPLVPQDNLKLLLLILDPAERDRLAQRLAIVAEQPNVKACPWAAPLLPPDKHSAAKLWVLEQRASAVKAYGLQASVPRASQTDFVEHIFRILSQKTWLSVCAILFVLGAIIIFTHGPTSPHPTPLPHNEAILQPQQSPPPLATSPPQRRDIPVIVPSTPREEQEARRRKKMETAGQLYHGAIDAYEEGHCNAAARKESELYHVLRVLFDNAKPTSSELQTLDKMRQVLSEGAKKCGRGSPHPSSRT